MIRKTLMLLSIPFLLTSCLKDSEPEQCKPSPPTATAPDAEVTALQAYINIKGLAGSVTKHPAGFFYKIEEAGSGITPNTCSIVRVTYEGKLTDDTKFDENREGTSFILNQLITGWQYGIPLVKKGGKIKLYLPPTLGYGNRAQGEIPANSILIFEVQVLDVAN
jgi:FKBP-type peptidyl-prolyl cis-trans isomerase FkpA